MTLSGDLWNRQGSEETREWTTPSSPSKIRRGTAQSHLNKRCPFFGGWIAHLILYTIGTNPALPFVELKWGFSSKIPLSSCTRVRNEWFCPSSSSSHFHLKSCHFHLLLFSVIPDFMNLPVCNALCSGTWRLQQKSISERICAANTVPAHVEFHSSAARTPLQSVDFIFGIF